MQISMKQQQRQRPKDDVDDDDADEEENAQVKGGDGGDDGGGSGMLGYQGPRQDTAPTPLSLPHKKSNAPPRKKKHPSRMDAK